MKLKSISFELENCETLIIDGTDIGYIFIDGIKKNVSKFGDRLEEYQSADNFAIEISAYADDKYIPFGCGTETTKFKRLMEYNDIVWAELKIETDDNRLITQKYELPYDGEEINVYQTSTLSRTNNLYIVVSQNCNVDDYFLPEIINNSVYTPMTERKK